MLEVDGEKVREMEVRLAPGEADWWAFMETEEFSGKKVTLRARELSDEQLTGFFAIRLDKTYPGEEEVSQYLTVAPLWLRFCSFLALSSRHSFISKIS